MIVVPEDREPSTPAALADRLRGAGARWSDADVRTAQVRLVALFGDDTQADGLASAVLTEWATRSRRPVEYLTRFLSYLSDAELLHERSVRTILARAGKSSPSRQPDTRPPWCGACEEHTRQREDEVGNPSRCLACHPLRAQSTAA